MDQLAARVGELAERHLASEDDVALVDGIPQNFSDGSNAPVGIMRGFDSLFIQRAGDLTHAREIAVKLLEFDASAPTQDELKDRLKRARQPDLLKEPVLRSP